MFEDKYSRAALIISFSLAVVLLGVHEIRRGIANERSAQYKDPNLVEHLYGVSVLEKERYTVKALEKFNQQRQEELARSADLPRPSWRALFEKIF